MAAHLFSCDLFFAVIFSAFSVASTDPSPPPTPIISENLTLFSTTPATPPPPTTPATPPPPPPPAVSFDLYHKHFFERQFKDPESLLKSQLKRDAARVNYLISLLSLPATSELDQTSGNPFGAGFAGILGLSGAMDSQGVSQLSLPTQLRSTLFPLCHPFSSSATNSRLNFNIVPQLSGDNVTVPLVKNDAKIFYFIKLESFYIGFYVINITPNTNWNGHVLVDTGTTFTRLPQSVYKLVRESTRRWMAFKGLKLVDYPPRPFDTCYYLNDADVKDFPNVELLFDQSLSAGILYLSGEQVAVRFAHVVCLAFLPTDSYFILGNTQLYGTALTFNLSAMTLTLTGNFCNK
ncbi:hypothetical protein OROMI_011008 [Orobanche minor]